MGTYFTKDATKRNLVHTIYLHRTPTCWIADMRWTPDANEIADVMGTCWIPTPFTPAAQFETVVAAVKGKNLGARFIEGAELTAEQAARL